MSEDKCHDFDPCFSVCTLCGRTAMQQMESPKDCAGGPSTVLEIIALVKLSNAGVRVACVTKG